MPPRHKAVLISCDLSSFAGRPADCPPTSRIGYDALRAWLRTVLLAVDESCVILCKSQQGTWVETALRQCLAYAVTSWTPGPAACHGSGWTSAVSAPRARPGTAALTQPRLMLQSQ